MASGPPLAITDCTFPKEVPSEMGGGISIRGLVLLRETGGCFSSLRMRGMLIARGRIRMIVRCRVIPVLRFRVAVWCASGILDREYFQRLIRRGRSWVKSIP